MLIRVVKMHFNEEFVTGFKTLFKEKLQNKIERFEGCTQVQLLQHETETGIFFTISYWESAVHLANYRNSDLFKNTWAMVKPNFSQKAEAWSLVEPC